MLIPQWFEFCVPVSSLPRIFILLADDANEFLVSAFELLVLKLLADIQYSDPFYRSKKGPVKASVLWERASYSVQAGNLPFNSNQKNLFADKAQNCRCCKASRQHHLAEEPPERQIWCHHDPVRSSSLWRHREVAASSKWHTNTGSDGKKWWNMLPAYHAFRALSLLYFWNFLSALFQLDTTILP